MVIETPSCHMMIELSRHVSLKKKGRMRASRPLVGERIEATKWHTKSEAIMS